MQNILLRQLQNLIPQRSENKRYPFVILNSDKKQGLYIRSIISSMKRHGLVEIEQGLRTRNASSVKRDDVIVVGDCDSIFDYDYRVVRKEDSQEFLSLDGRVYKVYDSVHNYSEILSKIEKYAKANDCGRYPVHYKSCCRTKKRPTRTDNINVTLRVNVEDEHIPVFKARDVRTYNRIDPISSTEKVTFFKKWVKIGLHQFDIEYDCLGNSYIEDGRNNKYYITEDRFGRRFLVTR